MSIITNPKAISVGYGTRTRTCVGVGRPTRILPRLLRFVVDRRRRSQYISFQFDISHI